jgi:hypothetical protein
MKLVRFSLLCGLLLCPLLRAELKLPAIIGDHMVLQQKQANPIWGWDTPGTIVSVTFRRPGVFRAGRRRWPLAGQAGGGAGECDSANDHDRRVQHARRAGCARGRGLDVLRPVQHGLVARADLHGRPRGSWLRVIRSSGSSRCLRSGHRSSKRLQRRVGGGHAGVGQGLQRRRLPLWSLPA